MATYQHSSWITLTGRERLEKLRLHIQEVSELIDASTAADGVSFQAGGLNAYLDRLMTKEEKLSSAMAGGVRFIPTRRI